MSLRRRVAADSPSADQLKVGSSEAVDHPRVRARVLESPSKPKSAVSPEAGKCGRGLNGWILEALEAGKRGRRLNRCSRDWQARHLKMRFDRLKVGSLDAVESGAKFNETHVHEHVAKVPNGQPRKFGHASIN